MNLLDWLLVALVATYALSGYWQGFVTGACATIGLLLGGVVGVWLAPQALGKADPSLWVSLGALFIVILSASLGQAISQYGGARLRERIKWQPIRAVDAVGGAVLSAAAVLIVAWALGVAVSGSRIWGVTPLVRDSTLLARVDAALPDKASEGLRSFNNVVGQSFFPSYLEPFARERIVEVRPGPRRIRKDPEVVRARDAVVKIQGFNSCGRGVEGSGFLYASGRLMTNAHVVAGVRKPDVQIGGRTYPGRVVYYNPEVDVAVLAVDQVGGPVLTFDSTAESEDGVAILGYPQDGPFDIQSARIRAEQTLRSPNIYGEGSVLREVFSLRGLVRPGNSGGPVLSAEGTVVGVVFAASVTDPDTGYALTADQVAESAAAGTAGDRSVSTGKCGR
ncbi:MAG: MarP family serine protease [Nocardioides sp.]